MSARQKIVRVADLQVAGTGETLITVGLGSCVAIVLYDAVARIGGMAHVLLPSRCPRAGPSSSGPTGRSSRGFCAMRSRTSPCTRW